ncbi:hypothetical protein TNCV_4549531 [Trichonephila clavipes]|nr:hypothetical protein TNCV_4549531 [Trichonephila clavipes]
MPNKDGAFLLKKTCTISPPSSLPTNSAVTTQIMPLREFPMTGQDQLVMTIHPDETRSYIQCDNCPGIQPLTPKHIFRVPSVHPKSTKARSKFTYGTTGGDPE